MKKLIFFLLLISTSLLFSQASTLVGDNIDHGGFGGPVVKFTNMNGEFGVLVGGRGGWIINHTFVLGLGGYGLANNISSTDIFFKNRLTLGYGGFEMEYIINSDDVIHFSIQTLIGGGSFTFTKMFDDDWSWDWEGSNMPYQTFFIAEPGVNVMLNIASFFRLGFGASYRLVSGVDSNNITNSDIDGFSGVLTFKFGSF